MVTGEVPFERVEAARYIYDYVNSTRFHNIRANLIHSLIEHKSVEHYGVVVVERPVNK